MKDFFRIRSELGRALQEDIQRAYSLAPDVTADYFTYSENYTYMLHDKRGDCVGVVNVHRPGYHTVQELYDELQWMHEVQEETDVHVPAIYKDKEGNFLRRLALSTSQDVYYYSVSEFLPGRPVTAYTTDLAEKVGEMTAQLHVQASARARMRADLSCFRWDIAQLLGPKARWGDWTLYMGHTAKQRLLHKAAECITYRLQSYPKDARTFFLIHADLHGGNLLQTKDDIALIDFDDCGYSWFLYDLGAFLSRQNEQLEHLIHHWCCGYERVRPLHAIDLSMIATFVLLRRLVRLGWLTTRADNDVTSSISTAQYIEKTIDLAEKYLRGQTYGTYFFGQARTRYGRQ